MKKLLKNSFFRILIIIFGNLSMLIFLFTYILPNTITTTFTAVLTIILFAIFMAIFTITMTCELCFDEASKHLVAYGDLDKAYSWMMWMHRIDIFNWYQSQYAVFMTIYYRDKNMIEELKSFLNKPVFQKNKSMELVYNYNQMLVEMADKNDSDVEKFYTSILSSYTKDTEKKNTALIYSLDMIKAEKNLFFKKCEEAKKDLSRVSMTKLNIREKGHFYFLQYQQMYCAGNKKRALKQLELARETYPQGACFIENED